MQLPIVQASPQVLGVFVSHLMEHIALKARDQVEQEVQMLQAEAQQAMLAAQVGAVDPMMAQQQMQAAQTTPEQIEARVAQIEAELTQQVLGALTPPQQEDPLVAIRQQELAIKAADTERRAQNDQARLNVEQRKLQARAATDAARIESQEEIADERADVNRERIRVQRELAMRKG
jgi:hypothetical protein